MTAPSLTLDPAQTSVTIRTGTTGLFSPLAHDLELACDHPSGEATGGESPEATVRFPVESIRVVGAVKHGAVDKGVLSDGDRKEIERRIRENVITARTIEVKVRVSGSTAALEVKGPGGTAHASAPLTMHDGEGGAKIASGRCKLTLSSLGVGPVKGPMGVFRVADEIAVEFRAAFRLARPEASRRCHGEGYRRETGGACLTPGPCPPSWGGESFQQEIAVRAPPSP